MIVTNLDVRIGEAINKANALLSRQSSFYSHYTHNSYDDFVPDMANVTFTYVLYRLVKFAEENDVEVKLWTPKAWRFSNAIAMTQGKHIYLNRYKLNRSVGSIVGSLIHELVHIVEIADKDRSYGHGNNYRYGKDFPIGKRRTTPYLYGELAKIYVDERDVFQSFQLKTWPRSWGENN